MADSKLSDLTAVTTLGGDELVYVVDDPSGTPVDRKITATNLASALRSLASLVVGTNVQAWDADLDTLAAGGAGATSLLAALLNGTYEPLGVESPYLVVPVGVAYHSLAVGTHQTANRAFGMRFQIPVARSYRYARFNIGVQSGNIQVTVAKRTAGTLDQWTRVMDSTIIACPASGNVRLDLGATILAAGDYWLTFWADNTTVTYPRIDAGGAAGALGMAARLDSDVAGVGATGTWTTTGGGMMVGISLEATTP